MESISNVSSETAVGFSVLEREEPAVVVFKLSSVPLICDAVTTGFSVLNMEDVVVVAVIVFLVFILRVWLTELFSTATEMVGVD